MKNYYTIERYIKKFLKENCKQPDINFNHLSYFFMMAFEHFVRTTPLKEMDPCTTNGTLKHLERFKKMTNWATNNEWIAKNLFATYPLKFKHYLFLFLPVISCRKSSRKAYGKTKRNAIYKISYTRL